MQARQRRGRLTLGRAHVKREFAGRLAGHRALEVWRIEGELRPVDVLPLHAVGPRVSERVRQRHGDVFVDVPADAIGNADRLGVDADRSVHVTVVVVDGVDGEHAAGADDGGIDFAALHVGRAGTARSCPSARARGWRCPC